MVAFIGWTKIRLDQPLGLKLCHFLRSAALLERELVHAILQMFERVFLANRVKRYIFHVKKSQQVHVRDLPTPVKLVVLPFAMVLFLLFASAKPSEKKTLAKISKFTVPKSHVLATIFFEKD